MNFSKKLVLSILFSSTGLGLGISYIFASNYFNKDFFLIILVGITIGAGCGLISVLLYKVLLERTINIMVEKYTEATHTIMKTDKDLIDLGFDKICELYIHSLSEICNKYTQYVNLMKNLLSEISKAKENIKVFKEKIENIKSHKNFFELVLTNFSQKINELENKAVKFNNNIDILNKIVKKKELVYNAFNKLEQVLEKISDTKTKEKIRNLFKEGNELNEKYKVIEEKQKKLEDRCLKLYDEIIVEDILEQTPAILDNLREILGEINSEVEKLNNIAREYRSIENYLKEERDISSRLEQDEDIKTLKESKELLNFILEESKGIELYNITELLNIFNTSIKDIETILLDIKKLHSDLKESEELVKIIEQVKININYVISRDGHPMRR